MRVGIRRLRVALRQRDPLPEAPGTEAVDPRIEAMQKLGDPLTMAVALERAEYWWTTKDATPIFPTVESTDLFLDWVTQHRLGRKRLRDTMLAASYFSAGVTRIVTLNAKDFRVFNCFEIIEPPQISLPS